MSDQYRIIELLLHVNIKTHSEWHWPNFGRGIYSKNMSLIDFQELQLKNVTEFCFIILNIYIPCDNL